MTVLKPCGVCGELSEQSRCPRHRGARTHRTGSTRAWRKKRQAVLARDSFMCQCKGCAVCEERRIMVEQGDGPTLHRIMVCGSGYRLEVDHLNGNTKDDRDENLETVCAGCHRERTTSDRRVD